jgi:hypothetical protein
MKYLKEYSEEDLTDLTSDLKSIGQSDWMGFYITYKVCGDDSAGASAIAVVAESLGKLADLILEDFGIDDPEEWDIDVSTLKSVEDIMEAINDSYGSSMGSTWESFEFKFWEMNPKKIENSIEVADLLDTGDVLEMGRRYFSDFDTKVLQRRY